MAAGSALALAAAVVLLVRPRDPEPDTRTKGAGARLVLVGGPGLAPLASGDRIAPGDRLQAVYSATRDGFGAVLAIDRNRRPMSYVPSSGTMMVALSAGTQMSFPESTIADATPGEELVVILWCESPHPLEPLLARMPAIATPAGCTKHEVTIVKP